MKKAKWLLILLIVLPYPCLAAVAWMFAWQGLLDFLYLPLTVLVVAGTVPNGIYAVSLSSRPDLGPEQRAWMRRIKLWHVPFYLLLFVMCVCMAVTVVGLLLLPVLLVLLYAALLPASLYAMNVLRFAREQALLEKGEARVHAIQLFVPGLDIIAALELYAKTGEAS